MVKSPTDEERESVKGATSALGKVEAKVSVVLLGGADPESTNGSEPRTIY